MAAWADAHCNAITANVYSNTIDTLNIRDYTTRSGELRRRTKRWMGSTNQVKKRPPTYIHSPTVGEILTILNTGIAGAVIAVRLERKVLDVIEN